MENPSRVQLAIFAHNEAQNILNIVSDIDSQTLLPDQTIHVSILCNGCSDETATLAGKGVSLSGNSQIQYSVHDWDIPGKSTTWNKFVDSWRGMSCVDFLIFVDGDIRIRDQHCLQNLIDESSATDIVAVTSCPRATFADGTSWLLKKALSATATQHLDGPICGQLYAVKRIALDTITLPVPCLVEDGFLSACLNTQLFQVGRSKNECRKPLVKASPTAWHEFTMACTLRQLYHHSVRLAVGTELNAALYTALWQPQTESDRVKLLQGFAQGENMEYWFSRHEACLAKSSLNLSRTFQQYFRQLFARGFKGIVFAPLVIMKMAFMMMVNRWARKLFESRTFRW